jgi:hypothetical protein
LACTFSDRFSFRNKLLCENGVEASERVGVGFQRFEFTGQAGRRLGNCRRRSARADEPVVMRPRASGKGFIEAAQAHGSDARTSTGVSLRLGSPGRAGGGECVHGGGDAGRPALRLLHLEDEGRDPQAQVEEDVHLPPPAHERIPARAAQRAKPRERAATGANLAAGSGGARLQAGEPGDGETACRQGGWRGMGGGTDNGIGLHEGRKGHRRQHHLPSTRRAHRTHASAPRAPHACVAPHAPHACDSTARTAGVRDSLRQHRAHAGQLGGSMRGREGRASRHLAQGEAQAAADGAQPERFACRAPRAAAHREPQAVASRTRRDAPRAP